MASNVGGGTAATLNYLESAWLDGLCSTAMRANGVYRFRANPLALFDPRAWLRNPLAPIVNTLSDAVYLSQDTLARVWLNFGPGATGGLMARVLSIPALAPLFDMSPLREHLRKYVDLERIRTSNKSLIVNATDWTRGMPCIFTNPDMTEELGHDVLRASAAYTLTFPFVEMQGRLFAGGPATLATPIRPVIRKWAPLTSHLTVHCIYLSPPLDKIPVSANPGSIDGLNRWFSLNEVVSIGAVPEFEDGRSGESGAAKGAVTIHRYRPSKAIVDWFQVADFDRKMTQGFIELGYSDTLNHNCQAAGCDLAC
jgi:hypothetical protein